MIPFALPRCSVCGGKRDVVLPGGVAVCRGCDTVDAWRRPPNMIKELPR